MPPASFRPHLTVDPLPLAVCLLWSYRTRDFHPLDYTHAGRTPLSGFAGLLHGKGGGASHQRGNAFTRAERGWPVFRRPPGRYKKWRRRRRTSPVERYFIPPEGESPQPVREASAGPGQNPWRPGPKARRRHQPSRRSRVNLREYRKAPPRSRSRSRPRHRRPHHPLNPLAKRPFPFCPSMI